MTAPPTPQPKPTTQTTQTNTSAYTAALAAIFSTYRRVLSPIFASSGLGQCRYLPTCSEYAHIALVRYGPLRGSLLAAARLLRCHPWAAGGLDPVPDGPHAVSLRAAPQPADHEVRP